MTTASDREGCQHGDDDELAQQSGDGHGIVLGDHELSRRAVEQLIDATVEVQVLGDVGRGAVDRQIADRLMRARREPLPPAA